MLTMYNVRNAAADRLSEIRLSDFTSVCLLASVTGIIKF